MEHEKEDSGEAFWWKAGVNQLTGLKDQALLFGGRWADPKPLTKRYISFEEMARDRFGHDPHRP